MRSACKCSGFRRIRRIRGRMGRACNDNNNNNNRLSFAEVQYFVLKGSRYKWR